jgi:hypothetical protein
MTTTRETRVSLEVKTDFSLENPTSTTTSTEDARRLSTLNPISPKSSDELTSPDTSYSQESNGSREFRRKIGSLVRTNARRISVNTGRSPRSPLSPELLEGNLTLDLTKETEEKVTKESTDGNMEHGDEKRRGRTSSIAAMRAAERYKQFGLATKSTESMRSETSDDKIDESNETSQSIAVTISRLQKKKSLDTISSKQNESFIDEREHNFHALRQQFEQHYRNISSAVRSRSRSRSRTRGDAAELSEREQENSVRWWEQYYS